MPSTKLRNLKSGSKFTYHGGEWTLKNEDATHKDYYWADAEGDGFSHILYVGATVEVPDPPREFKPGEVYQRGRFYFFVHSNFDDGGLYFIANDGGTFTVEDFTTGAWKGAVLVFSPDA